MTKIKKLLVVGACQNSATKSKLNINSFNLFFVLIVMILAALELFAKKYLKSQIISVGVLGTFVGIFIGLQGFNPLDIMESVKDILVGLKTAFFTSIVGMSVAIILGVVQKLRGDSEISKCCLVFLE